jgi:plasmid stabilization system protein ParE
MKVEWSRQARSDLRAIHGYIARDSEHYARLQVKRLVERVEYVASRPMTGHPVHATSLAEAPVGAALVSSLPPGMNFLPHRHWLMVRPCGSIVSS